MSNLIVESLQEAQLGLTALLENAVALSSIEQAACLLVKTLKESGQVFSCGNGGSMCDAMHFAEELSGRYRLDRRALAASSISDVAHISCVGNDYGYEYIFSRYLEGHAKAGDCLLAISTSGASQNVIKAARYAKENGVNVIALCGKEGSPLERVSDVTICTPAGSYADRVQELHIKVIHILIEQVERELFPENYL
ncbi:SIS domain-containing protein [Vreelandella hamiltonii]|nr:SIS domain-containing protein [Halomonas hamiltonii]